MIPGLPDNAPETFVELCKILTPCSIRDDAEYDTMTLVMGWIAVRAQNMEQEDYAATLADLVTMYEIEHRLRLRLNPIHHGDILLQDFMQQLRVSLGDADSDTKFYAHEILKALESPRFKWRTINGISNQTGFEPARVRSVLTYLANRRIAIRSSALGPDGSELYSTRRHFKDWASFWELLGAGFRNRAA